MKITLTSDSSVRLEPEPGPMTIEAPTADRQYSPFHMLGSSLAFCTYSILASWATHADIATDGLVVDVEWTFVDNPHRIGELRMTFAWPELPENRRAAAKRAAALCAVHATLSHPPTITIEQAATAAPATGPTAAPSSGARAPEPAGVSAGDVAASVEGVSAAGPGGGR